MSERRRRLQLTCSWCGHLDIDHAVLHDKARPDLATGCLSVAGEGGGAAYCPCSAERGRVKRPRRTESKP